MTMRDAELPHFGIFIGDFGDIRLSPEFVAEARAKWPGETFIRPPSWLDRFCGVEIPKEPVWYRHVFGPLSEATRKAYESGVNLKVVKSLAALGIYE